MSETSAQEPESYDVLVIGGGPAGTAAALRAAGLGARTALVEARRTGGTCVNTGCVPTRVLARTARLVREVRQAGEYGIAVTEQPVDWTRTVARVRETIERVQAAKAEPEKLADAGVDLVLEGRARLTGPHEVELEDTGRRLRGRSVVLAVGGHSRRLPVPGAELAVLPEEVLDLPAIPRRLAVVGAGNTGAQLVTVFAALGSEVTLLEVAPRILAQTDADVSAAVQEAFVAQGVRVRTGVAGIASLERDGEGVRLTWTDGEADGGQERSEVFDVVITSTGWPASLEGLGLDAAGIEHTARGIGVDEHLRTNLEHVYAVGDANQEAMLVQAAHREAEDAAVNAVLGPRRSRRHELLPAGGFTDPDYADVGLTEEQARERDPGCVVALVPFASMERPVIDDRTRGFLKLVADGRREQLLGAHAVGESAVEVVQAVTTAMAAGVDVAVLARVEYAYPTYSAVIGVAARQLLDSAPTSYEHADQD
ncbi:NAD(P)/FAD-dependent oxidoreductase [uncultured Pseudokineococcus sp.]|uniref:dihydrolipoyl dehydrogenase family protein n=1 Tax=uncultured Pseudokineococcus sp. TaxID=1642928 RepID=UPI00262353DB|nr:NAD(P)/FAD-dependent oxidoreductase [uncultured Pseudokineococcus sp.]